MKVDLIEILKDCPPCTKLYSPELGYVKFSHIELDMICVKTRRGAQVEFSSNGDFYQTPSCPPTCHIFPDKNQKRLAWN